MHLVNLFIALQIESCILASALSRYVTMKVLTRVDAYISWQVAVVTSSKNSVR